MSVMDKFLDVMRLNPDDEDDYDNDDYDYEEEEEIPRRSSRREKRRQEATVVEKPAPVVIEISPRHSTKITPISIGSIKQAL